MVEENRDREDDCRPKHAFVPPYLHSIHAICDTRHPPSQLPSYRSMPHATWENKERGLLYGGTLLTCLVDGAGKCEEGGKKDSHSY